MIKSDMPMRFWDEDEEVYNRRIGGSLKNDGVQTGCSVKEALGEDIGAVTKVALDGTPFPAFPHTNGGTKGML